MSQKNLVLYHPVCFYKQQGDFGIKTFKTTRHVEEVVFGCLVFLLLQAV
jgi:hypothetical protein